MSQAISRYGSNDPRLGLDKNAKLIACVIVAVVSGAAAVPVGMRVAELFTLPRRS